MLKIRSPKYLAYIRSLGCIINLNGEHCNGLPVHAHHLTICGGHGMGLKECDSKTLPLCALHHRTLHDMGERKFWETWGLNAPKIALNIWEAYG